MTSPRDALELARDALEVARTHLQTHGGYNLRVSTIIENAEREIAKALERMKVDA